MSKEHLHKRLSSEAATAVLTKYVAGEMKAAEAARHLSLGRSRFFEVAAAFKKDLQNFTLAYGRSVSNNKLDPVQETQLRAELEIEKTKIIDDPRVPTDQYNYSYLRRLLQQQQSGATGKEKKKGKRFMTGKSSPTTPANSFSMTRATICTRRMRSRSGT